MYWTESLQSTRRLFVYFYSEGLFVKAEVTFPKREVTFLPKKQANISKTTYTFTIEYIDQLRNLLVIAILSF